MNNRRQRAIQAAWRRNKRATDPEFRAKSYARITELNRNRRRTPEGRLQHLVYVARKRAKKKGMACTISTADLGQPPLKCPVLGIPLNYGAGKTMDPDRASIDRLDNTKGYIPGNVKVISYRANSLKTNATVDEIRAVLAYMEYAKESA